LTDITVTSKRGTANRITGADLASMTGRSIP
jgi:hypothetical protein